MGELIVRGIMKLTPPAMAAAIALMTLTACSPKTETDKPVAQTEAPAPVAAKIEPQSSKPGLYQADDELLLEALDAADYPILADIFKGQRGEKAYCPDSSECVQFVWTPWDLEMKAQPIRDNLDIAARKAYLASLDGQAPHVQQETSKKAFLARYAQLSSLVSSKNVCFLYSPWKLEFLNDKYHLSGGNGKHTSIRFNLRNSMNHETMAFPGYDAYIMSANKFFAPIPAQTFGDANYKKFSSYSQKPAEERPVMKFCGKPAGEYHAFISSLTPPKPYDPSMGLPGLQEWTSVFTISKPIELVQPPAMTRIDTVPMEWFVPAL